MHFWQDSQFGNRMITLITLDHVLPSQELEAA